MIFECVLCGGSFLSLEERMKCPSCGGNTIIRYDYREIREKFKIEELNKRFWNIWRYIELLPAKSDVEIVSLGEGGTNLHKAEGLVENLKLKINLFLKDETTNPTGSFLDRGSSVSITHCRKFNYRYISTASKGNLGASLAAYAAKAGMKCTVYIPPGIDLGKLYQTAIYGADIKSARDMDEARREALSLLNSRYYPILEDNPFFLEGLKTTGYEIAEQMNWHAPDYVIVPMGDGGHISMIWKGFKEMLEIGVVDRLPKLVGVQFKGLDPIVKAFNDERVEFTGKPESPSEIFIEHPLNGRLAVQSIKESGGKAVSISTGEAVHSIDSLAKSEGIFTESASASTIAALKRLCSEGYIYTGATVICVLTGSGLKDPLTADELTRRVRKALKIPVKYERRIPSRIGETKLRILEVISAGEKHGYGIWRELRRRKINVKLPTVYQHLSELEAMKLVEKEKVLDLTRSKVIYRLTGRGFNFLKMFKAMSNPTD